jgi:D-alanine-D-alanine ligase
MKKNSDYLIGLLVGGSSSEREVSKLSSRSIYNALINLGYKVVVIDPALGKNQPQKIEDFFLPKKDYAEIKTQNYIDAIKLNIFNEIDVAFLGLHGKWGEDGTIQSLLEIRGVKYTGSGVLASALAMDKEMSKIIFKDHGVQVPDDFAVLKKSFEFNDVLKRIKHGFGFPLVVKPNDEGSSVATRVCKDEVELKEALDISFKYSSKTIIEEFIPGREMTVGILQDQILPVLEIKPKHFIYDYECKYTPGMSEYFVPAQIPEDIAKELQRLTLITFNSLECKGYARADFRLTEDSEIYCLEINTLPGMTSTSLIPKMAKAAGISFEELCDRIIKLSL